MLGSLCNPRYAQTLTYTLKIVQTDGGRRRTWRTQSIRDDTERTTNISGSTMRRRLGSGLYRCGISGAKVTGAPRGYRCPKQVQRDDKDKTVFTSLMRSGAEVDAFVTKVIAERLRKPDAMRKEALTGPDMATPGINVAISEQRARVLRAQRDYDKEIIEGRDLKRLRDAAEARIAQLETEQLFHGEAAGLTPVLGADDPSEAFLGASLEVQWQVIDVLETVSCSLNRAARRGSTLTT